MPIPLHLLFKTTILKNFGFFSLNINNEFLNNAKTPFLGVSFS